jgi:hypothetical protein
MGDDSTPIGSHHEANDDGERAPCDVDDGHFAYGGAEQPEIVLPEVMVEEAVNAEIESAPDQQVQHLSHFCSYQSFLFFNLIHFLHCVSIRSLEAMLATLLVMWEPRSILLQIN